MNLERLDRERRLRGWTKARLAGEMRVAQATISDIYSRGEAAPETFAKLTTALEKSPPPELAGWLAGDPEEGAA